MDDPTFPQLHIRPELGWVNDPNGVCLIDGRYHVFFQHNPHAPVPEQINWGHASSGDLLRWEYHRPALVPRPGGIDAFGCWSGCVVDDHGTPTAVYSAVSVRPSDAQVALARSDRDLIDWLPSDHGVVGPPQQPGLSEARDPYLFTVDGHRYAIQGSGAPDGEPAMLLYGCDDLERWQPLGTLLDYDDPVAREHAPANIWECPNLIPVGEDWVMIISRLQVGDVGDSRYLIGAIEPDGSGLRFLPRSGGLLDRSPVFYAPQGFRAEDRVLLWGWARDDGRPDSAAAASGWAGALTFPRELTVAGDRVHSSPAAELEALRQSALAADRPIIDGAFEVLATDGLRLLLSSHDQRELIIDEPGEVRMLVDGSLIEVYAPDRAPITARAYPDAGSSWSVESGGPLRAYRLALPD